MIEGETDPVSDHAAAATEGATYAGHPVGVAADLPAAEEQDWREPPQAEAAGR